MKKRSAKPRIYRRRLFFMTTTVCLIFVSVILWTVFFNMKNAIYENETNINRQMLLQTGNNIEYTMWALYSTAYSVYNSNDTKQLIHSGQKKLTYDYIKLLNDISNNFVNTNPSIHSVYIYNKKLNTFFSTFKSMYYLDEDFSSRISRNQVPYFGMPIVREVEGNLVCTQIIADTYYYSSNEPINAIYINYKLNWVLDNINIYKDQYQHASLFIMDEEEQLINAFTDSADDLNTIKRDLLGCYTQFNENDTITANINGNPCFITKHTTTFPKWDLYKIIPLSELNAGVNTFRNTVILINIISIMLIIALYSLVTKRLYKPVNHMIDLLPKNRQESGKDEFSLVESIYVNQHNEIKELREYRETNLELLEESIINRLLSNSSTFSENEFEKLRSIYKFNVNFDKPYRICICSFDDIDKLEYDLSKGKMIVILKLILKECFSSQFQYDCTYDNNNCIVILLNEVVGGENLLKHDLQDFQRQVFQELKSTMSCAISECFKEYRNVNIAYTKTIELLEYRLITGRESIITRNMLPCNERPLLEYNPKSEDRIFSLIERNNFKDAIKEIPIFIKELSNLDTHSVYMIQMLFIMRLKKTIYVLNCGRHEPINMDIATEILNPDIRFLEDFQQILHSLFDLMEPEKGGLSIEQMGKVEQAIALIKSNYSDINMSATYLAEQVNCSAAHLGWLFKQRTSMSIPEYINDVRLSKAATWIKSSKLTIGEIAQRAGYHNESYFFRVFKKKFGITPRALENKYRR